MARLLKDLSTAVSHLAGATVSVASNSAKVIDSIANSTTTLIDGTSESTANLMKISTNATAEWAQDSEYSFQKNTMVNEAKQKALESVMQDEDTLTKLQEAEKASLLNDIFEDYDLV